MTDPLDPKVIGEIDLDTESDSDGGITGRIPVPGLEQHIDGLQARLAETEADLAEAKARNDAEAVKAQMMKPYADKTFVFVCVYCFVAAVLVLLQAWNVGGFQLSDMVLGILTGSTAVSVIGLVGIVVGGLFRAR